MGVEQAGADSGGDEVVWGGGRYGAVGHAVESGGGWKRTSGRCASYCVSGSYRTIATAIPIPRRSITPSAPFWGITVRSICRSVG